MTRRPKITVAGAGVTGLACAFELSSAGCDVTVLDPSPPMAGASGVAAGMLAPAFEAVLDAEARPHFDVLLAARDMWPSFEQRSGLSVDRSGAIAAGDDAWLEGLSHGFTQLGLHATEINITAGARLAPGLSPHLDGALMTREDWRVEATSAIAVLRRAVEAAGGRFETRAATEREDADILVVATGAARELTPVAPELAVLTPIKGHIVRLIGGGRSGVTTRGQGAYVTPGADGILVGATMEAGIGDPTPDPSAAGSLLEAGARLFPGTAGRPFELLAGVRAATPDGLPLVGLSAEAGVIIAAGARRNGWLLGPLAARVVTDLALGRDEGRYAARLDPRRFA